MITVSEVMTYLVENRAAGLPAASLAEVFDRLTWCLSDNGGEMLRVRKDWLECDDPVKIEVALGMSETFPYETREEMVAKFDRIADRWPRLTGRCDKIIRMWDQQFPARSRTHPEQSVYNSHPEILPTML